jgi:hypothetical protein
MSPELMTAIGVIILGVITAFFGFMKYVFDKLIKEIKPNGGKSLKDQVTRLENRVDDIYNILLSNSTKRTQKRKDAGN